MESESYKNTNTNIYGRSLRDDLESFFNDLSLRNALAVFDKYDFIYNAKHLSEILKIDSEDANDKLECLTNLGLLKNDGSKYYESKQTYYQDNQILSEKDRAFSQAGRLIQVAGLLEDSDKFSDIHSTQCCTEEDLHEFKLQINSALENLIKKSIKAPKNQKNILINFIVGYTETNLKTSEDKNDA